MWPGVKTLHIRRCAEWTISTVSIIALQLGKLKKLALPEKIAKSDPKLVAEIWEDLVNRRPQVLLDWKSYLHDEPCLFLADADQESTDSEVESGENAALSEPASSDTDFS